MMSSLGDSGFSVAQAGHWLWQRPHSVHVVKSRMPFHEFALLEWVADVDQLGA